MTSRAPGRHRAAVRPKTPLSTLATQVSVGAGTVGRRGAVLAASSGLVVSLGVGAADAAPVIDLPGSAADGGSSEAAPTSAAPTPAAPAADEAAPAPLTVPADVEVVAVGAVAGQVVAPPPPPPPPAPPATTRASRSADRAADRADETTQAPAPSGTLSASRENVMAVAARYVGVPYVYGGTSPSGFDCSGYLQYVYAQVGVSVPRTSSAIAASGTKISRDQAQPGDVVYMPGHIGIYAGGNMMYDAPSSGGFVSKREMWSSDFGFYRVMD